MYNNIFYYPYDEDYPQPDAGGIPKLDDKIKSVPISEFTFFEESKQFIHLSFVHQKSYKFFIQDDEGDLLQISLENKLLIWDLNMNE